MSVTTVHILSHSVSQVAHKTGLINLILQRRKVQRNKLIQQVNNWQSLDSNPSLSGSKYPFPLALLCCGSETKVLEQGQEMISTSCASSAVAALTDK
jgi:hypothetical protein